MDVRRALGSISLPDSDAVGQRTKSVRRPRRRRRHLLAWRRWQPGCDCAASQIEQASAMCRSRCIPRPPSEDTARGAPRSKSGGEAGRVHGVGRKRTRSSTPRPAQRRARLSQGSRKPVDKGNSHREPGSSRRCHAPAPPGAHARWPRRARIASEARPLEEVPKNAGPGRSGSRQQHQLRRQQNRDRSRVARTKRRGHEPGWSGLPPGTRSEIRERKSSRPGASGCARARAFVGAGCAGGLRHAMPRAFPSTQRRRGQTRRTSLARMRNRTERPRLRTAMKTGSCRRSMGVASIRCSTRIAIHRLQGTERELPALDFAGLVA